MKKLLWLLTIFLMLTGCTGRVNLLPGAEAPEVDVYQYDGTTVREVTLYDREAERILRILQTGAGNPVEVDVSTLQPPVYGFRGHSAEKWDAVGGLWADGVFLCEDGMAYTLDEDFSGLFEEVYRGSRERLRRFPCIQFLAKADGNWNTAFLYAVTDEPEPPEGISLKLEEQTDLNLTVRFVNETEEIWYYHYGEYLEVFLDGLWYWVPSAGVPASYQPQRAGLPVEGGASATETIPLSSYGDLPAGRYRLMVQGMELEFTIA